MEWIERLNQAVSYIEEHLAEEIRYEELGRTACCSAYHFQRMFGYMAGIPLSEYIRRRRMSLAAVDLMNGEKIIDVALKYGYSRRPHLTGLFRASTEPLCGEKGRRFCQILSAHHLQNQCNGG